MTDAMIEKQAYEALNADIIEDVGEVRDLHDGESADIIAFTRVMVDRLTEDGDWEDGEAFDYKAKNLAVNGYSLSQDEDSILVIVSDYHEQMPSVLLKAAQVEKSYSRALSFVRKCMQEDYFNTIQSRSPALDIALILKEKASSLTSVRICFLTNGRVPQYERGPERINNANVTFESWDIIRLYRLVSSGRGHEHVEIDFKEEFGTLLPCLRVPCDNSEYSACLTYVPGDVLAGLYQTYGARLLEKNVRAFLQAKGKVNRKIRDTIKNEPHMFMAYNNGISITAKSVEFEMDDYGRESIRKIDDLQIVNGGQTTASLLFSKKTDGSDLSKIFVQAKISVVVDDSKVDEVVSNISRYSNSQNKVSDADFDANSKFHIMLQDFSRKIWTPDASSMWFYERARGQYADEKAKCTTPKSKKDFARKYPSQQKFTKTDLAKYVNTWEQFPYYVSRGGEKNFRQFTIRLMEMRNFVPDETFFKRLVAKAIIFKSAEKIVSAQGQAGYRANVVAYTLALLLHKTECRINLDQVWKEQRISNSLAAVIDNLSRSVRDRILADAEHKNVTEWCKREKCWESILTLADDVSADLDAELLANKGRIPNMFDDAVVTPEQQTQIDDVKSVPAEKWKEMSAWGKQTDRLTAWQRSFAFSIGKQMLQGKTPTAKQAKYASQILEVVRKAGFKLK